MSDPTGAWAWEWLAVLARDASGDFSSDVYKSGSDWGYNKPEPVGADGTVNIYFVSHTPNPLKALKNVFVGGTLTHKASVEHTFQTAYYDKYKVATYSTTSTAGKERLFNVNTTITTDQYGEPSTTVDYSLNLYFYKLKINVTDMGVEQEIGVGEHASTSYSYSLANGYSMSSSVNGHGIEVSARPGLITAGVVGVTALAIVQPEIVIPLAPAAGRLIPALVPAFR